MLTRFALGRDWNDRGKAIRSRSSEGDRKIRPERDSGGNDAVGIDRIERRDVVQECFHLLRTKNLVGERLFGTWCARDDMSHGGRDDDDAGARGRPVPHAQHARSTLQRRPRVGHRPAMHREKERPSFRGLELRRQLDQDWDRAAVGKQHFERYRAKAAVSLANRLRHGGRSRVEQLLLERFDRIPRNLSLGARGGEHGKQERQTLHANIKHAECGCLHALSPQSASEASAAPTPWPSVTGTPRSASVRSSIASCVHR